MTARTFTFNVAAPDPPAWFSGLQYDKWEQVTTSPTLSSQLLDRDSYFRTPYAAAAPGCTWASWAQDDYLSAYNGWCVDQSTLSVWAVANGGHANGGDNGAFKLTLGGAAPAWSRVVDGTPGQHMRKVTDQTGAISAPCYLVQIDKNIHPALYLDGRPAAMHSAGVPIFANGRVWFAEQSSYAEVGKSTGAVFSFDTTLAPRAYDFNDPLPWRYHGNFNSADGFGRAAHDPVNNRLVHFPQGTSRLSHIDVIDTAPGTGESARRIAITQNPSAFGLIGQPSWALYVGNLGTPIFIVQQHGGADSLNQCLVIPASDILGTGATWQTKAYSQALTWTLGAGDVRQWGAAYSPLKKCIFIFNQNVLTGGQLYKLTIPLSGGVYDSSVATWTIQQITVPSVSGSFPPTSARGPYQKFCLIEDMGNGEEALIMQNAVAGPLWVIRLRDL